MIFILTLSVLSAVLFSCKHEAETTAETVTETQGRETEAVITETETGSETEPVGEEAVLKRYFIYRIWNFSKRELEDFKYNVDEAVKSGFNAIKVHMPWHRMQSADKTIDYAELDSLLDYVTEEKGLPAAVSIDFARRYGDGMLSDDELMRDINGRLCVGDVNYERAALSFCSDSATEKAVSFYKDAVTHINGKYGDKILLYLPAFTQYCETEYWCAGQYDYSDAALTKFRKALSDKFSDISGLNEVTGKDFASFDDVKAPPCTDSSPLGVMWYNFRHEMLKSFIDRLADVQKSAAPDSKLALQLGSVFDEASSLRCTLRFADLCEKADILWIDDAPLYDHKFSMDYVRSSLPDGVEIAQEIDGPLQYNASPEAYLDQGLTSYGRGAVYLSIANWTVDENYRRYENVWEQISSTWLTDDPPDVVMIDENSAAQTASVYDLFKKKSPSTFISKYNKLLKNSAAVKITVVDDMKEHEQKVKK